MKKYSAIRHISRPQNCRRALQFSLLGTSFRIRWLLNTLALQFPYVILASKHLFGNVDNIHDRQKTSGQIMIRNMFKHIFMIGRSNSVTFERIKLYFSGSDQIPLNTL